MRSLISAMVIVLLVGAVGLVGFGWHEPVAPVVDTSYAFFVNSALKFHADNAIKAAQARLSCLEKAQLNPDALALVNEAKDLLAEAMVLYDNGDYTGAAMAAARAAMKLSSAEGLYNEMMGDVLCPDVF